MDGSEEISETEYFPEILIDEGLKIQQFPDHARETPKEGSKLFLDNISQLKHRVEAANLQLINERYSQITKLFHLLKNPFLTFRDNLTILDQTYHGCVKQFVQVFALELIPLEF